jgi:hypothetical protein
MISISRDLRANDIEGSTRMNSKMQNLGLIGAGMIIGIGGIAMTAACLPDNPAPAPQPTVIDCTATDCSKDIPGDNYTIVPCAQEDDTDNCYWDAATRGNGQGTSFVWLNGKFYQEAK